MPDGRFAVSAGAEDHYVRRWDVQTGRETTRTEKLEHSAQRLSASRDGRRVLFNNGFDYLWDVEKDTKPRLLKAPFASIDFDLSPDGRQALFASNKEVILWDVDKEVEIVRFTMPQQTERVVFSRDGRGGHWQAPQGSSSGTASPNSFPFFLWLFDLEQKNSFNSSRVT